MRMRFSVGMIGLHLQEILPSGVVEIEHGLRVFLKTCRTRQFFCVILLPHTVCVAEGGYSTLFADSGTSEDHDFLSYCHG